ncbi:MAG: GNAT family N-acetyltransferase [Pseudomonadota bacterium]
MNILYKNSLDPTQLRQLERWFTQEWAELDPLLDPQGVYPEPILAENTEGTIVGALAFTQAAAFDTQSGAQGVWINAVLVDPRFRGQGVASRLINEAEQSAKKRDIKQLWVLTHLPALYLRLSWQIAGRAGADTVLSKELNLL